ncbi:MAG: hypothetical protein JSS44_12345 [Proteobacteria bacterium]|nr:hypothetical protein [Pseudomonadota bacterium]
MPSSRVWLVRLLILIFGAIWAFPNTVLGLVLGLPALAFGARLRCGDGALLFLRYPWGSGGALTLGNVIVCTHASLDGRCLSYAESAGLHPPTGVTLRLGDHERAHVYQAMALGVLFLPLYFLCGGICARNRFERAADRYALLGRGWWPWAR